MMAMAMAIIMMMMMMTTMCVYGALFVFTLSIRQLIGFVLAIVVFS